jgi:hypothetical protein
VVGGLAAYWKLFLRVTHLVSRRQEYRSDELACYSAGSNAMAQGLERVHTIASVCQPFWNTVAGPALYAGYRPPLADGFERYYRTPQMQKALAGMLEKSIQNSKMSAYDTHPPLKLRLERIRALAIERENGSAPLPAVGLLDDLDTLEKQLLQSMLPDLKPELKPMDWDSAPAVWLPIWREFVVEYSALLAGHTLESIPVLIQDLAKIGSRIRDPPGALLTREQRTQRAANLLWMALAVRLVEQGWTLHMPPGQLFLSQDEMLLPPQETIQAFRAGKLHPTVWRDWCREHRLESVALADPSRLN